MEPVNHSCSLTSCSCCNYNPKYIYQNNGELISLIERDFQELTDEISLIYNNNIEILEYDKNDIDLINAVEDNKKIINKKLDLLNNIKFKLKKHSPSHPFVELNVMEYIKSNKKKVILNINESDITNINSEYIKNDNKQIEQEEDNEDNDDLVSNTQMINEIDL